MSRGLLIVLVPAGFGGGMNCRTLNFTQRACSAPSRLPNRKTRSRILQVRWRATDTKDARFLEPIHKGWWIALDNQRQFWKWYAASHGISHPSDWYKVTEESLRPTGGMYFITEYYQSSVAKAIMTAYPDFPSEPGHVWHPWRFPRLFAAWWLEPTNIRLYFDWSAQQLKLQPQDLSKWYQVEKKRVQALPGGAAVLKAHGDRLFNALVAAYPEHSWLAWEFEKSPGGWWFDPDRQRQYLAWLGPKLGFTAPEGWYKLHRTHLVANKGNNLLKIYGNSPSRVVTSVLKDHIWKPWLFHTTPKDFWRDMAAKVSKDDPQLPSADQSLLQEYLHQIAQDRHFSALETAKWARIELNLREKAALDHFGGLLPALRLAFPQLTFPTPAPHATQASVNNVVETLLPRASKKR